MYLRSQHRSWLHACLIPPCRRASRSSQYLRTLCETAAVRRYGAVTVQVKERLDEEFDLIEKHNLAGFLLLYREIVGIARQMMVERGLVSPETPLEERPPGRGRGSSVALLVGYLIGISHVDLLKWNLTLERFISAGHDHAARTSTWTFRESSGTRCWSECTAILGRSTPCWPAPSLPTRSKASSRTWGKPWDCPRKTCRSSQSNFTPTMLPILKEEMLSLPAFRDKVTAAGWCDLIQLGPALTDAPKGPRPTRRRHDPERHAHFGAGAHSCRRYGGPLHHGLE